MSFNTFDLAKVAQNFVPAGARPACSNCTLVRKDAANNKGFDGPSWRCGKGGFYTSAMAICAEHKPVAQERDTKTAEMFS